VCRLRSGHKKTRLLTPPISTGKEPRYYQRIAIERSVMVETGQN
jgi:hypothetical protein